MGGWKLEIGKMAIYMTFPVATFHYFNQPKYFEEWVVKVKRELYPPENKEHREMIEKCINDKQRREDMHLLLALEERAAP